MREKKNKNKDPRNDSNKLQLKSMWSVKFFILKRNLKSRSSCFLSTFLTFSSLLVFLFIWEIMLINTKSILQIIQRINLRTQRTQEFWIIYYVSRVLFMKWKMLTVFFYLYRKHWCRIFKTIWGILNFQIFAIKYKHFISHFIVYFHYCLLFNW